MNSNEFETNRSMNGKKIAEGVKHAKVQRNAAEEVRISF
jgi:hypothetical protein